MATENPKGGAERVVLRLTDPQRQFLRRVITDCMAGRQDDLQSHPDDPCADRWHAEAETYGRIIAGIDSRSMVADAGARRLVGELAEANDREEEYERIVFEHDALAALRMQLGTER